MFLALFDRPVEKLQYRSVNIASVAGKVKETMLPRRPNRERFRKFKWSAILAMTSRLPLSMWEIS
jgi:hypothetical protein